MLFEADHAGRFLLLSYQERLKPRVLEAFKNWIIEGLTGTTDWRNRPRADSLLINYASGKPTFGVEPGGASSACSKPQSH